MKVQSYRDLVGWQKAMELVYAATRIFPGDEIYGLTSQARRAAVSIPSNIAEGQAGRSTAEFLNVLSIPKVQELSENTDHSCSAFELYK